VIRFRLITFVLGQFLAILGLAMLLPLAIAMAYKDGGAFALGLSSFLTASTGGVLAAAGRGRAGELSIREGLLLVVTVWLSVSLFGCLPFYLSPHFPSFTDAFFESASGFTTTGATVLPAVEVLPGSLQFWRCFTHWIGGMGIVVLGVAILPLLGIGGMHLYRAEFSGARSEKLTPRIAETAAALWKIYFAVTFAEFVALRLAGMSSFEALLHSFSTLGTGGFSTRTASIAGFNSALIEWIVIFFMLLGGINFTMQYRLWVERRPRRFFRDIEVRAYLAIVALATAVITVSLLLNNTYGFIAGVRTSMFQVVSIMTTTGFITADFEQWTSVSQLMLLALMFVGGCTGSTAGGLKINRILLLINIVNREFKRMVHRHGVFAVRLRNDVIPETTVQSVLNMVYLSLMLNFAACVLVASTGADVLTSITAVATCMFNVGPGLGSVGPSEHFGHLPAFAKWVLAACMVAGRLEFYTAFVIFTPAFWRR
jgi:trk system potassium uptake protein TrkH